jgi:hypothetical protein
VTHELILFVTPSHPSSSSSSFTVIAATIGVGSQVTPSAIPNETLSLFPLCHFEVPLNSQTPSVPPVHSVKTFRSQILVTIVPVGGVSPYILWYSLSSGVPIGRYDFSNGSFETSPNVKASFHTPERVAFFIRESGSSKTSKSRLKCFAENPTLYWRFFLLRIDGMYLNVLSELTLMNNHLLILLM